MQIVFLRFKFFTKTLLDELDLTLSIRVDKSSSIKEIVWFVNKRRKNCCEWKIKFVKLVCLCVYMTTYSVLLSMGDRCSRRAGTMG